MTPSARPSERVAIIAAVNPVSSSSVVTSSWVSLELFNKVMAVIQVGALGASATVDAKIQQASDSSGTGAKDVSGKSITQFTKAGSDDNKQAVINLKAEDLDAANGFTFVRLSITPATAACLVAGLLLGFDARQVPASDNDAASVDEIVG